jgi:hypothetical protein
MQTGNYIAFLKLHVITKQQNKKKYKKNDNTPCQLELSAVA